MEEQGEQGVLDGSERRATTGCHCSLLFLTAEKAGILHNELADAWGRWIEDLGPWEWFVTLTFRDPSPGPTQYTKPGWARAKSAWRDFTKFVDPPLGGLRWVRAFEEQPWRGVPHVHALVAGMNTRQFKPVSGFLWKRYGFCRILEYDRELGAQFYLTKYVTKELADFELSPHILGH